VSRTGSARVTMAQITSFQSRTLMSSSTMTTYLVFTLSHG
jgi:hypothetical protein